MDFNNNFTVSIILQNDCLSFEFLFRIIAKTTMTACITSKTQFYICFIEIKSDKTATICAISKNEIYFFHLNESQEQVQW